MVEEGNRSSNDNKPARGVPLESVETENSNDELHSVLRIDELCDRFETAWLSGQKLTIEECLALVPAELHERLLESLLPVEIELRKTASEHPFAEEYISRFETWTNMVVDALATESGLSSSPGHSGSSIELSVIAGPHAGTTFRFDHNGTFLVGRSSDSHLTLEDDPQLSRFHFRLEFSPPNCCVVDLESSNGTLVNGERIQSAPLSPGDIVAAGETQIEFQSTYKEQPPTPFEITETVLFRSIKNVNSESDEADLSGESTELPARIIRPSNSQADNDVQSIADGQSNDDIPGYKLSRILGRGSMGTVYRAFHRGTGKKCAVKVMAPDHAANEKSLQLFTREATLLSQLNHPGIVRFFEMGYHQGQLFLVMEYVRNKSIKEILDGQPRMSHTRIICRTITKVLDALTYAHDRSLVHRDIKPTNILLSITGGKLRVKLGDFGLAKNYANAGFSGITEEAETRGTLAFMPPEQIMDSRFAKPTCDLYATGVTMYQYLSGRLPFEFSTVSEGLAQILNGQPTKLGRYRPDLPDELLDFVSKAISENPEDRFRTAQEMASELSILS